MLMHADADDDYKWAGKFAAAAAAAAATAGHAYFAASQDVWMAIYYDLVS